jgi:hypothetical protein
MDILTDRITTLCLTGQETNLQKSGNIKKAVSIFMASYFDCCRIDTAWKNMLQSLQNDHLNQVAIVTDHYAEATTMIINRMADWNIEAIPLVKAVKGTSSPLIIANSADVGFHKIDYRFWRTLYDQLFSPDYRNIKTLLIDDFGANEAMGDQYGNHAQVTARQEKTRHAIEEGFGKSVDIYPFMLKLFKNDPPKTKKKKELYCSLVENALSYIQHFTNSPCP